MKSKVNKKGIETIKYKIKRKRKLFLKFNGEENRLDVMNSKGKILGEIEYYLSYIEQQKYDKAMFEAREYDKIINEEEVLKMQCESYVIPNLTTFPTNEIHQTYYLERNLPPIYTHRIKNYILEIVPIFKILQTKKINLEESE